MSLIDMSAELVDALQAQKTETNCLENILKERDATIAQLKLVGAASHKAYGCEGDLTDTEIKPANVTYAVTPAAFVPFVERTILPLLKGGLEGRTVVVTVPEEGGGGGEGECVHSYCCVGGDGD
ncbi:hypothetical protein N7G274_000847 [Stereocaulon virgatum]|uniref:Uncharacterized protein n=1 Tax=Stereocaulon virgatum TaxID=373712 RepID=A0ABR4AM66_9LECA